MPVLNLKNSKRIRDQIRLTTQRVRVHVFSTRRKQLLTGFAFVSEMNDLRISVYIDHHLRAGSEAQISFDRKDAQAFRSRVLISNRHSMSQSFLGTPALHFRSTLQFSFASEFEREQFLKYYKDLRDRSLFLAKMNSQEKPQPSKKAA